MKDMKIALATDDGKKFIDRHFGDANLYKIYRLKDNQFQHITTIDNTVDEEEEVHADPKKAKGIAQLLKQENVQVVCSRVFGPNIKRIRKKFVCIVIGQENLQDGLKKVEDNLDLIESEWEKGRERKHLVFRD
ncbi:MAG TPA: NifB/NifX family molybdenum-iron cluster-binding protein [bacterium]|nr:NifB/NifX family molybdenum-iron cluster-binding protein [bacterium]